MLTCKAQIYPGNKTELAPITRERRPNFEQKTNNKNNKVTWLFRWVKNLCQVSAWQSATLLTIIPVSAQVDVPVSPVRQYSSGDATNNPPFPKMP